MVYGTTPLLIEEVVTTNSSTGIESSSADIILLIANRNRKYNIERKTDNELRC